MKSLLRCSMLVCVLMMFSGVAFAGDITGNACFSQKNKLRTSGGSVLIDGPVNDISVNFDHGPVDGSLWVAYDSNAGRVYEIDFILGYSFDLLEELSLRIGIESWEFVQKGGDNEVVTMGLNYSGLPIDLEVEVTQLLDEEGSQVTGSFSREFFLFKRGKSSFTLRPMVRVTGIDDYFGVTSWPSNIIYSCKVAAGDEVAGLAVFAEYHDGKAEFGNDEVFGVSFSVPF